MNHLLLTLSFFGCLLTPGLALADWVQDTKLVASDANTTDYFGHSVSTTTRYAIVGAPFSDPCGVNSGSAYIYRRDDPCWLEEAIIIASDANILYPGGNFGYSVSISDPFAVVGAPEAFSMGLVYVFRRFDVDPTGQLSPWRERQILFPMDANTNDDFGASVAIDGRYIIVGSPYNDETSIDSGSAYIFHLSETGWNQQAKLTASDSNTGDSFGWSVAISGEYAVVGTPYNDANGVSSGAAYVFKRTGSTWSRQAKLIGSRVTASDGFGFSVAISDPYVIAGAWQADANIGIGSSGLAYIFKRTSSIWNETAILSKSDPCVGDHFGFAVSINDPYALVGVRFDNGFGTDSGAAYLFKRDTTCETWSAPFKLHASDAFPYDNFGYSVSITDDCAIIGANQADANGIDSGAGYTFERELPNADLKLDGWVDFNDFAEFGKTWQNGD